MRRLTLAIILLLLLPTLSLIYDKVMEARRLHLFGIFAAPYLHTGDHKPTTTLSPGDVFYIHTETVRSDSCTVELYYRLVQEHEDDNEVQYRTVYGNLAHTRATTTPGIIVAEVRLQLPDWITPGAYAIDRQSIYSCDGVGIQQAPLLRFNVVARG